MICKIIPVKSSNGVKDCWEYISDENKVISIKKQENGLLQKTTIDTSLLGITAEEYAMGKMDFDTVLAYMENDEKTHRVENVQEKFISGFMCDPETAVQEFLQVKRKNLELQDKTVDDETGAHAYHIIQSFPEDLDISDEEVHQCGRELCEKLHLHQAVICSHVHPVINEEGEVAGKCKHNHILINSHIKTDLLDPEKPNVYKYHDCNETYVQLQKWNDEIAMEHGLPIIREKKGAREYSWIKTAEENKGCSWTAQVARDIKNTMRFCNNWEEFKTQMTEQGYYIRETAKNITYYSPAHTEEHKQRIRESRLGKEFTKTELEHYWSSVNMTKTEMADAENRISKKALVAALIDQYGEALCAEVLCKNKYSNNSYYLDIPLKNPRREMASKTLYTYFDENKTYKLSTSDHIPIAEVSGQDLFDYYEELRKTQRHNREKEETSPDRQQYYFEVRKINSKTNHPYKISRWDPNGRQRTMIELICILAMVVIKREHAPQSPRSAQRFKDGDGNIIYAKTDWKLQNMYDTMVMAKEMNLQSSADIEKKLDRTGKEVARKRKQLKSLTTQYNQMKTINENIETFESVKDICEEIYHMPDGPQKEEATAAHAAELQQYTNAKRYLHLKNINSDADVANFKQRYQSTTNHYNEVTQELETFNSEYRKLKKIQYNVQMAQNNQYCYGPDHESLAKLPKDEEKTQENINLD